MAAIILDMPGFNYPKDQIIAAVARLNPTDRRMYPEHIYDPERIEIARELALKEYYKLMPFLHPQDFDRLGSEMIDWFNGQSYELAPVHDYWNFVGGMIETLKLKTVNMYLTSENISWSMQDIDPRQLRLYRAMGDLQKGDKTEGSWGYQDVQQEIVSNPERLALNKQISDEKSQDTTISRDDYPIIVIQNIDDTYKLLDGNRRVMRAWLYGVDAITAWVGRVQREPALKNYWVSASFLRLMLMEYQADPRPEVAASIRSQLEILFAASSIAKYHYQKRCIHMPGAAQIAKGIL